MLMLVVLNLHSVLQEKKRRGAHHASVIACACHSVVFEMSLGLQESANRTAVAIVSNLPATPFIVSYQVFRAVARLPGTPVIHLASYCFKYVKEQISPKRASAPWQSYENQVPSQK